MSDATAALARDRLAQIDMTPRRLRHAGKIAGCSIGEIAIDVPQARFWITWTPQISSQGEDECLRICQSALVEWAIRPRGMNLFSSDKRDCADSNPRCWILEQTITSTKRILTQGYFI